MTGVPVIAVGSVGLDTAFLSKGTRLVIAPASADAVVAQFEAGEFDVIAVGRALLADPGWVNLLRDDTLDGFNGYDVQSALSTLH
ncbi:hypothetical protein EAH80_23060 [Mycobacterium hodleri]|uniref:Oxidoreductase n=1 Tax=Mycolicibacterium hodleri TaxID=49897 RepID=A0A502E357_9MYCO|nr:hypothetical protein EAH80_23060 [Mycolicibacterium hodleri]